MSNNPEKDAIRAEARKQQIMDAAFHVFTEKSIDSVTMNDVAAAAGVGVATVYRHYSSKPVLVLAVATRAWQGYTEKNYRDVEANRDWTAAQIFACFLETFIDLYRHQGELLRFNQMFNIYVRAEAPSAEQMAPYRAMIAGLAERFHAMYEKAQADHTLRTDVPEAEMFSATLHLMLAAVTRYAIGLVYDAGIDPERELQLLREMLMGRYEIQKDPRKEDQQKNPVS